MQLNETAWGSCGNTQQKLNAQENATGHMTTNNTLYLYIKWKVTERFWYCSKIQHTTLMLKCWQHEGAFGIFHYSGLPWWEMPWYLICSKFGITQSLYGTFCLSPEIKSINSYVDQRLLSLQVLLLNILLGKYACTLFFPVNDVLRADNFRWHEHSNWCIEFVHQHDKEENSLCKIAMIWCCNHQ